MGTHSESGRRTASVSSSLPRLVLMLFTPVRSAPSASAAEVMAVPLISVISRPSLRPAIRLGTLALRRALAARVPAMLERAGAKALMLQHAVVSAAAVERAHEAGAAVWAWTVDDPMELARLEAVLAQKAAREGSIRAVDLRFRDQVVLQGGR